MQKAGNCRPLFLVWEAISSLPLGDWFVPSPSAQSLNSVDLAHGVIGVEKHLALDASPAIGKPKPSTAQEKVAQKILFQGQDIPASAGLVPDFHYTASILVSSSHNSAS